MTYGISCGSDHMFWHTGYAHVDVTLERNECLFVHVRWAVEIGLSLREENPICVLKYSLPVD